MSIVDNCEERQTLMSVPTCVWNLICFQLEKDVDVTYKL